MKTAQRSTASKSRAGCLAAGVLSCLVLYTPLAGRMLRAGGRDGPPPPPQYMPRRALASPRVGARITRVRFSTKSNYLSHIRSSHIRLQSSVDHCQTGVASESLSTAVASLPGSHFLSHLSLPLTYNPPIHSLSSAKPGPYRLPHPTTQFGVRLLQIGPYRLPRPTTQLGARVRQFFLLDHLAFSVKGHETHFLVPWRPHFLVPSETALTS